MSEIAFKKGGCCELRNDRSLMMWLLGSTDVKILTRTHSVRTQGTGMKKSSSSWWRPLPHIYGETRCGKKSERCSCTSWSSTVLLQTYNSTNLPCTHRSSWFDKRRSKRMMTVPGSGCTHVLPTLLIEFLHWLISCLKYTWVFSAKFQVATVMYSANVSFYICFNLLFKYLPIIQHHKIWKMV